MHSVARRRLAARSLAFFQPMNAILVDPACCDFRKRHLSKERDQMTIRARMLSTSVRRAPLSLGNDVELAEINFRSFVEHLPGFEFTVAEFASKLQVPV